MDRWNKQIATQRYSEGEGKKDDRLGPLLKLLSWSDHQAFNAFLILSVLLSAFFLSSLISPPIAILIGIGGAIFVDIFCRIGNLIVSKMDKKPQVVTAEDIAKHPLSLANNSRNSVNSPSNKSPSSA